MEAERKAKIFYFRSLLLVGFFCRIFPLLVLCLLYLLMRSTIHEQRNEKKLIETNKTDGMVVATKKNMVSI